MFVYAEKAYILGRSRQCGVSWHPVINIKKKH